MHVSINLIARVGEFKHSMHVTMHFHQSEVKKGLEVKAALTQPFDNPGNGITWAQCRGVPTDLVSSLAGSDFWTPVHVPLLPAPGVGQQIPTLVKDCTSQKPCTCKFTN
jgi:hypothetical protein